MQQQKDTLDELLKNHKDLQREQLLNQQLEQLEQNLNPAEVIQEEEDPSEPIFTNAFDLPSLEEEAASNFQIETNQKQLPDSQFIVDQHTGLNVPARGHEDSVLNSQFSENKQDLQKKKAQANLRPLTDFQFQANQKLSPNSQVLDNQNKILNSHFQGNQQPLQNSKFHGSQQLLQNTQLQGSQPPLINSQFQGIQNLLPGSQFEGSQEQLQNSLSQENQQPLTNPKFQIKQQPLPISQFQGNQRPISHSQFQLHSRPLPNSQFQTIQQPLANSRLHATQQPISAFNFQGNQPLLINSQNHGNQRPLSNFQFQANQQPFLESQFQPQQDRLPNSKFQINQQQLPNYQFPTNQQQLPDLGLSGSFVPNSNSKEVGKTPLPTANKIKKDEEINLLQKQENIIGNTNKQKVISLDKVSPQQLPGQVPFEGQTVPLKNKRPLQTFGTNSQNKEDLKPSLRPVNTIGSHDRPQQSIDSFGISNPYENVVFRPIPNRNTNINAPVISQSEDFSSQPNLEQDPNFNKKSPTLLVSNSEFANKFKDNEQHVWPNDGLNSRPFSDGSLQLITENGKYDKNRLPVFNENLDGASSLEKITVGIIDSNDGSLTNTGGLKFQGGNIYSEQNEKGYIQGGQDKPKTVSASAHSPPGTQSNYAVDNNKNTDYSIIHPISNRDPELPYQEESGQKYSSSQGKVQPITSDTSHIRQPETYGSSNQPTIQVSTGSLLDSSNDNKNNNGQVLAHGNTNTGNPGVYEIQKIWKQPEDVSNVKPSQKYSPQKNTQHKSNERTQSVKTNSIHGYPISPVIQQDYSQVDGTLPTSFGIEHRPFADLSSTAVYSNPGVPDHQKKSSDAGSTSNTIVENDQLISSDKKVSPQSSSNTVGIRLPTGNLKETINENSDSILRLHAQFSDNSNQENVFGSKKYIKDASNYGSTSNSFGNINQNQDDDKSAGGADSKKRLPVLAFPADKIAEQNRGTPSVNSQGLIPAQRPEIPFVNTGYKESGISQGAGTSKEYYDHNASNTTLTLNREDTKTISTKNQDNSLEIDREKQQDTIESYKIISAQESFRPIVPVQGISQFNLQEASNTPIFTPEKVSVLNEVQNYAR